MKKLAFMGLLDLPVELHATWMAYALERTDTQLALELCAVSPWLADGVSLCEQAWIPSTGLFGVVRAWSLDDPRQCDLFRRRLRFVPSVPLHMTVDALSGDGGVQMVAELANLQTLVVHGTGDERQPTCFVRLGQMPQLRVLRFSGVLVDDEWLPRLPATLEELALSWSDTTTDRGVSSLRALPSLRKLELNWCTGVVGSGLLELAATAVGRQLRALTLTSGAFNSDLNQALVGFRALAELRLRRFENVSVLRICDAVALRLQLLELTIVNCGAQDFTAIAGLTRLEELIVESVALGSPAMRAFATLPLLRTLRLRNCPALDNEAVAAIAHIRHLVELEIAGEQTSIDLSALRFFPPSSATRQFRRVIAEAVQRGNRRSISDESVQCLDPRDDIVVFDVSGSKITDTGIQTISRLRSLRCLRVGTCTQLTLNCIGFFSDRAMVQRSMIEEIWTHKKHTVTDAVIPYLRHMGALVIFRAFDNMSITDAGMEALCQVPQVREVNVMGCERITDEGLKALRGMRCLQSLNISRIANITDEGLLALADVPGLRDVTAYQCYRITIDAMTQLREQCGITVHFSPDLLNLLPR